MFAPLCVQIERDGIEVTIRLKTFTQLRRGGANLLEERAHGILAAFLAAATYRGRDLSPRVAAHLDVVRRAKAAHPDMTLVGTGYTYLMDWLPNVAQAEVRAGRVDSVGLGRMVLSYPEMPRDVLEGKPLARKLVCRTFSDCTTAPRNGMVSGCYPLDADYRTRPERERLKEIKRAFKEGARP